MSLPPLDTFEREEGTPLDAVWQDVMDGGDAKEQAHEVVYSEAAGGYTLMVLINKGAGRPYYWRVYGLDKKGWPTGMAKGGADNRGAAIEAGWRRALELLERARA